MSDDAVKLAREILAHDQTGMMTFGGITLALARAVIAQDDELQRLRAALTEALDGWSDTLELKCDGDRVAELRRLL